MLTVIGRDLVHPTRLDAEQQLQTAMSKSQQLEQRLQDWNSDQRVIDGQTAIVVIQLENRIADLDARLQAAAQAPALGADGRGIEVVAAACRPDECPGRRAPD